jgi:hypothetical protein
LITIGDLMLSTTELEYKMWEDERRGSPYETNLDLLGKMSMKLGSVLKYVQELGNVGDKPEPEKVNVISVYPVIAFITNLV